MLNRTLALVLSGSVLASCASAGGGMPPLPGRAQAAAARPRETFTYQPAVDRDVRVTVGAIVMKGDPDFIPSDANWLQVRLTIANIGGRPIKYVEVKERLSDGQVVDEAHSADELMKAPSYVKSTAATIGIGTAGMIAGSLLFPPAALLGGAAIVFAPMFQADRAQRVLTRVQQQGLHPTTVAPGTSISGYEFVPAVAGQTGLIVFYEAGGAAQTLTARRSDAAAVAAATPPTRK